MGLDMYLTKKIYVGGNYKHNKITGSVNILKDGKPLAVDLSKVTYIEESAIYWRKANAIHNWFVSEVQDGFDECMPHWVSFKQLQSLSELCQKTIDTLKDCQMVDKVVDAGYSSSKGKLTRTVQVYGVDQTDLPISPTSGFFFGSNLIDQYFVEDLEYTIKAIVELDPDAEYEYCSSSW